MNQVLHISCLAVLSFALGIVAQSPDSSAPSDSIDMLQPPVTNVQQSHQPDRPRLLLGRPNSFSYERSAQLHWVAAVFEPALTLLLTTQKGVEIVDGAALARRLPDFYNFERRISKQKYRENAPKTGATHVVYCEFDATNPKSIALHISITAVGSKSAEENHTIAISPEQPHVGLQSAAQKICVAVAQCTPVEFDALLLLGSARMVRTLGEQMIAACSGNTDKKAAASKFDRALPLSAIMAGRLYEQNQQYADAAVSMESIVTTVPNASAFTLRAIALHARAGNEQKAAALTKLLRKEDISSQSIAYVQTLTDLAANNPRSAAQRYETSAANGWVEPDFLLAGAAAHMHLDMSLVEKPLTAWCSITRETLSAAYRELGDILNAMGSHNAALKAYSQVLILEPENESTVLKVAQLQQTLGNGAQAAESYEKLVSLNALSNRQYLDTAAAWYHSAGLTAQACKVYREYLQVHRDPHAQMALARLVYAQTSNCDSLAAALTGLDERYRSDPLLAPVLSHCLVDSVAPTLTLRSGAALFLSTGSVWRDPGVTAHDQTDGDISSKVTASGSVTTAIPGTYQITYTVCDKQGNCASAVRSVIVDNSVFLSGQEKRPGRSGSRVVIPIRIVAAALAIGSLGGAIAYDRLVIVNDYERYQAADTRSDVDKYHNKLQQSVLTRTAYFAACAVSGAGLGISFAIPAFKQRSESVAHSGGVHNGN